LFNSTPIRLPANLK